MPKDYDNNNDKLSRAAMQTTNTGDVSDDPSDANTASSSIIAGHTAFPNQNHHDLQRVQTYVAIILIVILGAAASASFLTISILSSKQEVKSQFEREATELVSKIKNAWHDYEYAGLWIHESCRHRNTSRQEFRELYEYIRAGGLEFQAAEFIPNVTHDLRQEMEADALEYYGKNFPEINYRGFIGFEPVEPGSDELSIQPRSEQPFYFVVHHVEPVESNAAAIHLDLFSSSKRRGTIESALKTWSPALTDRLRLVQETDESAYSVLLMHPGIRLESSPDTRPRDLSLVVIRVPSLLTRATREQLGNNLAVYLYDTTKATKENPPQFLGGIELTKQYGSDAPRRNYVDEIELAELLAKPTSTKMYMEQQVQIASSTWDVVVVPMDDVSHSNINMEVFGGVLIFIGTLLLAFWMYFNKRRNDKMYKMQMQAQAERNIVKALFPSNVRDRLIRDALVDQQTGFDDEDSTGEKALSSETIFGSKPIAEFFTEVTVIFADLAGFTAWSSTRDPTQVFAFLEVIYHSFDVMAKRRGVFKLETVGDCYVAVCGIPDPLKDHAERMAQFATDCLIKLHELTSSLEISMGPDTADLDIRIGIHSGPVTAGVLRGDKGRFQLFGDTMNTAERIQSTGVRSKIHLSSETAELLKIAGHENWITERKDAVYAKGKGMLKTYWLDITTADVINANKNISGPPALAKPDNRGLPLSTTIAHVNALKEENHNKRTERLINWSVEVFSRLLKLVIAKRIPMGGAITKQDLDHMVVPSFTDGLLNEVKDVVSMPAFDGCDKPLNHVNLNSVHLDINVENELYDYISVIAELYHRNPFHNFEHAGHVLMSVCKLFTRIVTPRKEQTEGNISSEKFAAQMHDNTFGIASDPLTRFACAFSALIHDVDHPGVPNTTLVSEQSSMAIAYNNTSIAEQNSITIAWDLLMSGRYQNLVNCLCPDEKEIRRFRQLVVNMVMATDVMDKEIGAKRKERWEKAFSTQSKTDDIKENANRKATIVIEHLIQASDVSHTMQHWHVYQKWNENLFHEMFKAYKAGRLSFDPSEVWYEGEMKFFDFYIIPLAKNLDTCGVFGVSSDELLNYAEANRKEWESKGEHLVRSYIKTYTENYE